MLKSKGGVRCKVAFGWRLVARKKKCNMIREVALLAHPWTLEWEERLEGSSSVMQPMLSQSYLSNETLKPNKSEKSWGLKHFQIFNKKNKIKHFLVGGHNDVWRIVCPLPRETLLWDPPVFAFTLVHLPAQLAVYNRMMIVGVMISWAPQFVLANYWIWKRSSCSWRTFYGH